MGTAYNRSWSHSRQQLYDRCPRAFFYEYFPWDEPWQNEAWFLKNLMSADLLAGQIVHRMINIALRQYRVSQVEPIQLEDIAAKEYATAVALSQRSADLLKSGKRPLRKVPVLQEHFYPDLDTSRVEAASLKVENCITNLFSSPLWTFLQKTQTNLWLVPDDLQERPFVNATKALGFQPPQRLKIFTGFDFAFDNKGDFILIDWKTGAKSEEAQHTVRKQMATYALFGIQRGYPLDQIKVQAAWLQDPPLFEPVKVSPNEIQSLIETIQQQNLIERRVCKRSKSDDSPSGYKHSIHIKDFPAMVFAEKCLKCKFRALCREGRERVKDWRLLQGP